MENVKESKKSGKKVIFHGHSTKEDFQNSFIGSNIAAPFFKQYLMHFYRAADLVITPTDYSASLLRSYGIKCPILPISNGIDLTKYSRSEAKEQAFREYFSLKSDQKVVVTAALYFKRKGIDDFIKVAERMPDVTFIWFGYQNLWTIPGWIRRIVKKNHPKNVFSQVISREIFLKEPCHLQMPSFSLLEKKLKESLFLKHLLVTKKLSFETSQFIMAGLIQLV